MEESHYTALGGHLGVCKLVCFREVGLVACYEFDY